MKISVIGPVKNEVEFIGYSIMDSLPYVHEYIYACAESDDGTDELLDYIKEQYAGDKLKILRNPAYDFNPKDTRLYNAAFNDCIKEVTGEAVWFKHPDMICLNPEIIPSIDGKSLAYWTEIKSYAKDFKTLIQGRQTRWKNIHKNEFGLHYYGDYGSVNEDFYHSDITGDSHVFHGSEFKKYPFEVSYSGLKVNHYCELKPFKRRFEKMKSCLRNLYPEWGEGLIQEMASKHPRVTLEDTSSDFGNFSFVEEEEALPPIFKQYKGEFSQFIKEAVPIG
jgi:glycosyltransferase involved in cell wall biosynthesis